MASPTTAVQRFDLSMSFSEFSLRANRDRYIGLQVLPAISVGKESGNFLRVNVESLLTKVEDTQRAPKATYKRGDYEWAQDSYIAEDHGVEEEVDDESVNRYGDILRSETLSRERAINRILQALENDIATTVFDSSYWTGADYATNGSDWTDHTNSTPIADVDGARKKVRANSGHRANALVVPEERYIDILRSDEVQDLLKYDAATVLVGQLDAARGKELMRIQTGLQELFHLDRIIIAGALKNSADLGQDASFSDMWDDSMTMVCRIRDDGLEGDLEPAEPHIGRTIFWDEESGMVLPGQDDGEPALIVEEYREEPRRGGVIRARFHRQVKRLHKESGHLLTGLKS